jgi:hypothetical protein
MIYFYVQTFQGSENEIGSFPVIIRTRHFRSPRIGWTHMRLQPRLDVHNTFIEPMFLFSPGEITNVENGTSSMTPIIGHVECNAFDHIPYECTRIVLTFKSLVLVSLFLFGHLCGRRASTALPSRPESRSSFLIYISPNSVCVYLGVRKSHSLQYVPVFHLAHCGRYPSHPFKSDLALSHGY